MSASKRATLALPQRCHDAMFAATPADVAQLVEQRFRKPQVTGSNPVVGSSPESFQGCHAVASAKANRLMPSNFLLRVTAWRALDSELLESEDWTLAPVAPPACRRRVER